MTRSLPVPWLVCIWLALFATICLADSAGEHDRNATEHTEEQRQDDVLRLTPENIKRMGIEIVPVDSGTIREVLELPGEVVLNNDRTAHIVPRFDGVAREVRKHLGDHVAKGDVVALIESNNSLETYEVKSLIDGTIIEKHIALGEFVSTESAIYVVADLADVWVNVSVYARDQLAVHTGQPVTIKANDFEAEATGVLSYVSPIVDENTRTGLARLVLPNPDRLWRPGTFVTADILVRSRTVDVVVPSQALQTLEEQSVVFVETPNGFEPRAVTVGQTDENRTEITEGLKRGERIVTDGAFTIKAQLLKRSFGGGHGH